MNSVQKKQFRNIRFTLHQNLDSQKISPDDFKKLFSNLNYVRFAYFQLESTEKGTPHYQGYAQLSTPQWRNVLHKDFLNADIKSADATPESNIAYCSKKTDDQTENGRECYLAGPWVFGDPKLSGRPAKSQIKSLDDESRETFKMVKEGKTDEEIRSKFPRLAITLMESIRKYRTEINAEKSLKANTEFVTIWEFWYGNSGSGKTTILRKMYPKEDPRYCWIQASTKNSAKLQLDPVLAPKAEVLIVEEVRIGHPEQYEAIKVIDGGLLEYKGGTFFHKFKKVIFVARRAPFAIYKALRPDNRHELCRRINKVYCVLKKRIQHRSTGSADGVIYSPTEWFDKYQPFHFDVTNKFRKDLDKLWSKIYTPELDVVQYVEEYRRISKENPGSPELHDIRLEILDWLNDSDPESRRLLLENKQVIDKLEVLEKEEEIRSEFKRLSKKDLEEKVASERPDNLEFPDFSLDNIVYVPLANPPSPILKLIPSFSFLDLLEEPNDEFFSRWKNNGFDEPPVNRWIIVMQEIHKKLFKYKYLNR